MSKPGSTDKPGYLYHQPAYPVDGKQLHRSDNRHRLRLILENFKDWQTSNVLDVGCNVGYFSIMLALQGARVTGIDLDADAIALVDDQARMLGLGSVSFQVPTDRTWLKDKDVLLALSVLPWIYQTEKDPDTYVRELFNTPVAFVEIQYPPDGRAMVPGVTDEITCRAYLEQYYLFVDRIGETVDETNGVRRRRTMWKCVSKDMKAKTSVYGSQSIVEFRGDKVVKVRRPGKVWDAAHEADILRTMRHSPYFPEIVSATSDSITMRRISGVPLTAAGLPAEDLYAQLDAIARTLQQYGISHNDIRPENIIVNHNGRVHLFDFGWATKLGEDRPEGVNPLYPGTDREAMAKILERSAMWRMCG